MRDFIRFLYVKPGAPSTECSVGIPMNQGVIASSKPWAFEIRGRVWPLGLWVPRLPINVSDCCTKNIHKEYLRNGQSPSTLP